MAFRSSRVWVTAALSSRLVEALWRLSRSESLEKGKPLVVVVNEKLMNSHQFELAKQLHAEGRLVYCPCSTRPELLQPMELSTLEPYPPGQPEQFSAFLDKVVGLQK